MKTPAKLAVNPFSSLAIFWLTLFFWIPLFFLTGKTEARAQALLSGQVFEEGSGAVVPFASIVLLESREKSNADAQGRFELRSKLGGKLTLIVRAEGLKPFQELINLERDTQKTIRLSPLRIQSEGIAIVAQRDLQKLSRNSLKQQDLKDAPATFGDSLNALATLPSVLRSSGFFGSLIIRGADSNGNRYFINDVPVLNPQHFGAIQSVISNDLIERIDLFSSSFPVRYGQALAAVIDMETVDTVKTETRVIDVSLISSNFYWARPWRQRPALTPTQEKPESSNSAQGYWIAAARISYLTLAIPPLYELLTGKELIQLPEYYDYQWKGKFFLDERGRHSLTLFLFGSYDTFRFLRERTDEEKQEAREDGEDPLLDDFSAQNELSSHSQSLRYQYRASSRLQNYLTLYNNYILSIFRLQSTSALALGINRGSDIVAHPNVAGLKEKLRWEYVEDVTSLEISLEYQLYYFQSRGVATILAQPVYSQDGPPDLGNDDLFSTTNIDQNLLNHLISAYAEHKTKWLGTETTIGVRTDYLHLTKTLTIDPRLLFSYTTGTDTTISMGGGYYSSFIQTNQFLYNQPFSQEPQAAAADYLKPERAIHRSVGLSQKWNLYTMKVEGFYNTYASLLENSADPVSNRLFLNSGKAKATGAELFLRKDRVAGVDGLYFWISYTYTESQFQSNSPLNTYQGIFFPFEYEQPHSMKITAGYVAGRHQFGIRFELFSGFPYTPITGSTLSSPDRYSPVYGTPFSRRFEIAHRLDLRYSQTVRYAKSMLKWYIEIINVYNNEPKSSQSWNYNIPYQAGVNPILTAGGGLSLIPNFRLEYRF